MGIRTRRARAHSKTHFVGFSLAGLLGFIALLCVALAVSLGALVSTWLEDLPDYTSADAFLVAEPTRVYDADGNELVAYYLQNRRSVELDQISDYVKKGTVNTEDVRFYTHNGIDPEGIMRAVLVQLAGGSEGGSTITQQLVRGTVLSAEQFEISLRRKVREAYISIQMEKTYTKDQILNMYLNTIYYGNGAYGVEAASITYFNKHANELTLNEAATLVGIPNSPTYFDPFASYDACKGRRNVVLSRMLSAGTITQEEYDATVAEEIPLNPGELTDTDSKYPFFTDYVRNLLLQDFSYDTINTGGLNIYTTLEPAKQQVAEESVSKRVEMANNSDLGGALVSVDNSNGHIVAMVGGQNYGSDTDNGQSQVNLATSRRQAGSSFKAIVLTAALNSGMSPTVMIDNPASLQVTPGWEPHNYGNHDYGVRTLADATVVSSNTGYVQVAEAIGMEAVIETAADLGIDSTIEPGLASALGSSGVTPLEMCEAFSTIASGGVHRNAVAITRIEDRNGNVVYEHQDEPTEVLDMAVADDVIDVLEGDISSLGTAWVVASNFHQNQPVAGKTGTSDYSADLWFCGFTPQYTTVVWYGHQHGNSTVLYLGAEGTTQQLPQPTWCDYMNAILDGVPRAEFPQANRSASYKPNDSWVFIGSSQEINREGWTPEVEEGAEDPEEEGDEQPTTPETPTEPTTPEPPTEPETPEPPTEPETPSEPETPETPEKPPAETPQQ